MILYVSSDGAGDGRTADRPARWTPALQTTPDLTEIRFARGHLYDRGPGAWMRPGVMFGAYGNTDVPRPTFWVSNFVLTQQRVDGLVFEDLDIQDTGEEAEGMRFLGGGIGLTIRRCDIIGFANNITVQGTMGRWQDVMIEDCVIADATRTNGRAQGIYVEATDGISISRCVVDRCGTTPSTQSHGVYIHALCTELLVQNTIFSRCAATGLQARCGGRILDNVFIQNPISMTYGYVQGNSNPTPGGVAGSVDGNVIVEGNDIDAAHIRGIGMQLGNMQPGSRVWQNLIARTESAQPWEAAMQLYVQHGIGMRGCEIIENQIIDWNGVLVATNIPVPEMTFARNTIHRVRYPVSQPLMKTRASMGSYVDTAWLAERSLDNTLIERPDAVRYPMYPHPFTDFDGIRAREYTAAYLARYFRDAYNMSIAPPAPEPEPLPTEMTVTIPPHIERLIVEFKR